MQTTRRRRTDRGAALVEFALVVPLLALFLFGIVQFGLAYDKKQSVNSAAREGARMAAIPDETNVIYSTIKTRVDNSFDSISNGGVDTVTVVVVKATAPATTLRTCTVSGCTPNTPPGVKSPCTNLAGETVIVTVTREQTITIPFFGVSKPTLTGRGEFRCEADV